MPAHFHLSRRSLVALGCGTGAALSLGSAARAAGALVTVGSAAGLGHVRYGTGPVAVIVLHEWLGDHRNYDDVLRYLSDARYSYIFADLRGYGLSRHIEGRYSAEEAAGDVIALARQLGLSDYYLAVHSMSGMIGQYMLTLEGPRIAGLVAVSPVPASGFAVTPAGLNALQAVITDDDAAKRTIDSRVGKRYSAKWLETKLALARSAGAPQAMAGYLAMFTGSTFIDRLRALQPALPVAVLTGQHDVEAYRADTVAKIWSSLYPHLTIAAENQEAGHYPMLETPVLFASTLEKMLDQMQASRI